MTLDEPYRIPTPRRILLEQLLWTLAPLCRRGQVGGGPCNGEGPILEQIYCENMRGWAPAVTHIHPVRFLLQTHWVAVLEPVSCESQWTALAPIGQTIAIVTVKFDDPSRPFREKYLELDTVKLGDPSRSFREDYLGFVTVKQCSIWTSTYRRSELRWSGGGPRLGTSHSATFGAELLTEAMHRGQSFNALLATKIKINNKKPCPRREL